MLRTIGLLAALVLLVVCPGLELRAQETTSTLEFRLAEDMDTAGWKAMQLRGSDQPIYVSAEVSLDGGHIEKVSFHKDSNGDPLIGLTLTDDGAKAMEATTSKGQGKKLAIVLNGKVVAAPIIQSTIAKEVQITGRFDRADLLAFFYAIVLRETP